MSSGLGSHNTVKDILSWLGEALAGLDGGGEERQHMLQKIHAGCLPSFPNHA